MKTFPCLLVILFTLFSCRSQNHADEPFENKIIQVDFQNSTNFIDLKLSDLVDSCWLVQLETTDKSILGNYFHYVFIDDEFIIIVDLNGIYKFSSNGSFIKKIITFGRGPEEFNSNPQLYYSVEGKILYINDNYGNKNFLSRYDVKSENFLEPVKKCFPGMWGSFNVINDSILVGSTSPFDTASHPYAIFTQNLKGNFIKGLLSNSKVINYKNEEQFQRMFIYSGSKDIHVRYYDGDTIYYIKENKLFPWLIVKNKSIASEHTLEQQVGETRSIFERYENPGFMIIRNLTYEGLVPLQAGVQKAEYDTSYYLINKTSGKFASIRSYMDDLTGKRMTDKDGIITFPTSLPNNLLYEFYYPHELINKKLIENINLLPETIYEQLHALTANLKETDNPVILIGVPKNNLEILK